jgi:hypothetical protein
MMGFALCERCGVPIAAFGPNTCDMCRTACIPPAKLTQVKKKSSVRRR